MKIWNRISIRKQLIVLITLLLLIIQIATFALIDWFDNKVRHNLAKEQSHTISRSLNSTFTNILLSPDAAHKDKLQHHLKSFHALNAIVLLDLKNKPIYSYGSTESINIADTRSMKSDPPLFKQGHLFFKLPIQADNYTFGHVIMMTDPEQYKTQIDNRFQTLLWLSPIELLLALLFVWRFGLSYTKPFTTLVQAMQSNDIKNNIFTRVSTKANNEIKQLFDGYNAMISTIERTTTEMRFQSTHDTLTGLLNRYGLESALERALYSDNHCENILLKVDLDQFKLVNDTAGFSAGDALLKLIAHHLHQNLPEQAIISRLDADEFVIILPCLPASDAKYIAKELLSTLKDFRFIWEGVPLTTSASCGLVSFTPYEYALAELMKAVDSASVIAKSQGRNKFHIYSPDDQHSQQLNLSTVLVTHVKEALGEGPSRFELYAQAIVPLQEQSDQVSYEILLRLLDHNGNIIPPDDFLPTADHYNLMADIDSYVLWTYLKTVMQHPEHIKNLSSVHINLSGSSLNHVDFQKSLKKAIETFDFPWHKLEMEVTETSAVGNLSKASDFINYFRGLGIGFALDDFGTGMSSFDYLKNLPFDIIKIDGSFVKDMHNDPVDHAVIRYIQEICDLKKLKTVAEYVEREEDVQALKAIGVTYGQGYHLGKPKPLSEWITPNNE